ncbi:MAG: hypothetical protein ACTHU0_40085 [Kofleriaceae bacterium]
MKAHALLLAPLSFSIAACGGGDDGGPALPPPAEIALSTTDPALVAFRDGLEADWQTAEPRSAGSYAFDVHGPYEVAVVCDNGEGGVTVHQLARTPDDPRALELPCAPAFTNYSLLSGMVDQPGLVMVGTTLAFGFEAPWQFDVALPDGSYDLAAITEGKLALRRNVVVNGDTWMTPDIDLDAEAIELAPSPLTATNLEPDEGASAIIVLSTPSTPLMVVSNNELASATKLPDSALLATDRQDAIVSTENGPYRRAVRRALDAGTAFTLPDGLRDVRFTVEGGELVASWGTLPTHDTVEIVAQGYSDDFSQDWRHTKQISARFVAETGIARATLDTQIPGFQPAWRLDLTGWYDRELTVAKLDDEQAVSQFRESTDPHQQRRPSPRVRAAGDLRSPSSWMRQLR